MPIDAPSAAAIGILSSIATAAIGFGIMKEKVRRIEDDLHDMRSDQKAYVTFQHFDAVIEPMRRTLEQVQKDIKEILRAVSDRRAPN